MDKIYWRTAFEAYAALAWIVSAMAAAWVMGVGRLPPEPFGAIASFSALMAVYRLSEAWTVWRHRRALSGQPVAWIDTETLHKKMNARPGHLWLGWGFEWTRVHLQRLYELEKVDVATLRAPWPLRRREGPRKGNPLLHGVEPKETELYVPIQELEGHLFVPATTGALKTRLLALMAAQAIRRSPKEAVIVVDPKGDGELLALLKRECAASGRAEDFVYFHPAFPQHSVRLDPIRNWSRTTEIASRIAALIPGESGNDPFSAFGWRVVNLISEGLILGENQRPTLKRIRRYVEGGPDQLLHNTLVSLLESEGLDWKAVIKPYLKRSHTARRPSAATSDETLALVAYYKAQRQAQGGMGIVDGLISMFDHNREHAQKMLASLIPVLTMLTAGDLAELLSPNREDPADPRPILDGAKIIESAAVVYVGLDSLADAVVGSAIGSIFLADLTAVAGARYNQQIDDPPINLFVDEANEAVNPPFIQLLNKARSAGFRVAFFSQTVPDFIAKLGNEALARQVLGNANTTLAGRTKDKITAQYAMETFGRTILYSVHTQQVTSAVVGHRDITNYTTSYGDRINETFSEIVPPEALGSLPDLEYFASLSGNRLVKGRIPLIKPVNRNR